MHFSSLFCDRFQKAKFRKMENVAPFFVWNAHHDRVTRKPEAPGMPKVFHTDWRNFPESIFCLSHELFREDSYSRRAPN